MNQIDLNKQFKHALSLMEETSQNVFITGKAGTGKSTLLQYFRDHTAKKIVVLAPTGVAAVNIAGQTIHSFFKFLPDITTLKVKRLNPRRTKGIYKKLDAIVIDEISMVRADLLDCVDKFMRLNGKTSKLPFGGCQMIFFGDLYQLPPVVTYQEREIFREHYQSPYFFSAKVFTGEENLFSNRGYLQKTKRNVHAKKYSGFNSQYSVKNPQSKIHDVKFSLAFVELEKVYRQKDQKFIDLLNTVRNNSAGLKELSEFNKRFQPQFDPPKNSQYIHLTSTNALAESINKKELSKLSGKFHKYHGEIFGEFSMKALPTDIDLHLKKGSQVMMLNNDSKKRWVNGTIGTIVKILKGEDFFEDPDAIFVKLSNGEIHEVYPHTWDMYNFSFDKEKNGIVSDVIGQFTQYPMKLAWAVTIHKSQGKTFDHVIIDIGRGTFAHGQMYVALSRCTTLSGIVLKKSLQKNHIIMDWRVVRFVTDFQYQKSDEEIPVDEKVRIIQKAIKDGSSLAITYLKSNDIKSCRVITPKKVGKMEYLSKKYLGIEAFCHKRKEDRMFRVDRILELKTMIR